MQFGPDVTQTIFSGKVVLCDYIKEQISLGGSMSGTNHKMDAL